MASRRDKRKSVIFGRNSPSMQSLSRYPINPTRTTALLAGWKRTTARCLLIYPEAGKCEFTTRQWRCSRETDKAEVQAVFFQLYFPDMHTNWQDSSTARRLVGWCNCSGRQFLRLKIFGYNPIKNLATKMRAQNQMP